MSSEPKTGLDATDWALLRELQQDARVSYSELGRRVALTPPAVAERIRRLEQRGIIEGYGARLDLHALGLPILAFVNIRYPGGDYRDYARIFDSVPEILECHHITGSDCFIAKVAARSMPHLEQVTAGIARIGSLSTAIVYSTGVRDRPVTERLLEERPER